MSKSNDQPRVFHRTCCPCGSHGAETMSRRTFLQGAGGVTFLGTAVTGLTWSAVAMAGAEGSAGPVRRPLVVKPILVYNTPRRRHQRSWRGWGGIQTEEDAAKEIKRITAELDALAGKADFPVRFLAVSGMKNAAGLGGISDIDKADVCLVYAAGGWIDTFDAIAEKGKDLIFFCRHKSGPIYQWYEIINPRYLRRHTDKLAVEGLDNSDVVIDSQDELLWRLRSLCGLRNTVGTRIIAVGGPSAWAQPRDVVPNLVRKKWGFDIQTVSYKQLGELIQAARADRAGVERAHKRAADYLASGQCTLETKREFLENAFVLDEVFRGIMNKAGCRAITINGCMGTIMPIAETSACMTLSLLNDAGYLAFCESDFVVIPSGVLLANISGKPVFLNDPTYPHDGLITLAHCTAPRKMNGKDREPARILTHFESDYGAAPKVQMRKGQVVTNIIPDFAAEHWTGVLGEIVDVPFMDICRSQIDIGYSCDDSVLAEKMRGFHWMTCYGDYLREVGYAVRKVGITLENLSA